MDNTELSYLAGFFDGEGCIFIQKIKSLQKSRVGGIRHCPNLRYRLTVQLTNTNQEVMDWVKSIGWYVHERKNLKKQWKRCWVGRLHDIRAYEFLKLVLPYLKVKKDEALLGIKFQDYKSIMPSHGRHGRDKEETDYLESIKAKLSELKNQNI